MTPLDPDRFRTPAPQPTRSPLRIDRFTCRTSAATSIDHGRHAGRGERCPAESCRCNGGLSLAVQILLRTPARTPPANLILQLQSQAASRVAEGRAHAPPPSPLISPSTRSETTTRARRTSWHAHCKAVARITTPTAPSGASREKNEGKGMLGGGRIMCGMKQCDRWIVVPKIAPDHPCSAPQASPRPLPISSVRPCERPRGGP